MLATAGVAGASAASASTIQRHQPPRAAYGSVELGSPLQYETFLAFQSSWFQGSRFHGNVDYTNWTYAEPGSGVFAPAAGSHALVFTYQGSQYAHTLSSGLTLVALSPDRLAFSGSGSYNGGGITRTLKGQVTDNKVRATIAYDGQSYKVYLHGRVADDGSVSGVAQASTRQSLTLNMPAGAVVSV